MSRSPLAYPLNRSADMDVGGAADLQTDIMRFMAILSLCLVAIFALVQSLPLTPAEPEAPTVDTPAPSPQPVKTEAESATPAPVAPEPILSRPAAPVRKAEERPVSLTRPTWVPKYVPQQAEEEAPLIEEPAVAESIVEPAHTDEPVGFVLRFASDAALMRAVAASHVGLYAIETHKAQRMTVSDSRVSFWEASTPNTFHEMEAATVPRAVIEALSRTGTDTSTVSWGVTLPGKLKTRLDALMQAHEGGSLIIGAGGDIQWEAS